MVELLQKRVSSPSELKKLRQSILQKRDPSKPCITVCGGIGCRAAGAEAVINAFIDEIERRELQINVELKETGCHGFCERGPLVVIRPQKIFYQRVKPENISEIISETVLNGNIVEELLYLDTKSGKKIVHESDVPFYKKQRRLLLANNSRIEPTNIDDYLAIGGYAALSKALFSMSPEEVIEEVKKSGLRGRSGGGFPTGIKWESCRRAQGDTKYIICNAEEGDPGAFVDRYLIEANPHSVLEGIIIGAYAIGGHEGYIYLRNDYHMAFQRLTTAIKQAEEYRLLGKDILGSGFDFGVRINVGGGAFICGESTALMASLEGRVGEPRAKYVHTVEKGLWDKPSNLNNVETWANVPIIVSRGADWYAQIGTEGSKGTKVFSLTGNVNNTGLVEVPMGIALREIIYDIGGGIPEGKKFKAVHMGGPLGGSIPESLLDTAVDFDELTGVGSMIGSGSMIVMDEDTCMVDIARYFINFLEEESCGKCLLCREGLKRAGQILANITEGRGKEEDIELLERLFSAMINGSLCGLGRAAPNPALTTIHYFGDEYEAHIKDKKCPASICKMRK